MFQSKLNFGEIKKKKKIDGEIEKLLVLPCSTCRERRIDFFQNIRCIKCLFRILLKNKRRDIKSIEIQNSHIKIPKEKFKILLDYFKIHERVRKLITYLYHKTYDECAYPNSECKYLKQLKTKMKRIYREDLHLPINLYLFLLKSHTLIKSEDILNQTCKNCLLDVGRAIQELIKVLRKTKIIKEFNRFKNKQEDLNFNEFYQYLFINSISPLINEEKFDKKFIRQNFSIIQSYTIGQCNLYTVNIYKIPEEIEYFYESNLNFGPNSTKEYFLQISERVREKIKIANFYEITPLEKLINQYKELALQKIKEIYNIGREAIEKLALFIAVKILKLAKIFPLLIDNLIEEIFLDAEDKSIYLNHQLYGRCKTERRIRKAEFERIKTLIRLYSGKRIDYNRPTLKYVLKNEYFFTRFAIDISPVHLLNYSLDVRKLDKNIMTIQDLIQNNTLNSKITAFLYFCILKKRNIMTTGETDTGKTTLINALDLLTPKHFRKIYVENIPESIDQSRFGKHQLKYSANSLDEENKNKISKSKLIKNLLHRSPDIIYLGEILTKEEAKAMFHCFASGLIGFQTIHARNINSLIHRFLFHFDIDKFCLEDLDLIILMKKIKHRRFIAQIGEVERIQANQKIKIRTLFQYNPSTNDWIIGDSYNSEIVQSIKKYEQLSKSHFKEYLNLFHKIFLFLENNKRLPKSELINLFHKISYYLATGGLQKLKIFWSRWKKNISFYEKMENIVRD